MPSLSHVFRSSLITFMISANPGFAFSQATGSASEHKAQAGTKTPVLPPKEHSSAKTSLSPEQIFSRNKASVVSIATYDARKVPVATGSGFVIGPNQIITNYSILQGSTAAVVEFDDGSRLNANFVVAGSASNDLAVLRVPTGGRPALRLGNENDLKVGEAVFAIGGASGASASLSNGLVSTFRDEDGQFLIQTTVPLAAASNGGPLLDRQGAVVGITTSRPKDSGFAFAIGAGDIQRLLRVPYPSALTLAELTAAKPAAPTIVAATAAPVTTPPAPAPAATPASQPADPGIEAVETLFDNKKYQEASAAYDKLSAATKKTLEGQLLLGNISSEIGNYQQAVNSGDAAIVLRPNSAPGYRLKAYGYLGLREFESAEQAATKALALASDKKELNELLGLIYYLEEKYPQVVQQLSSDTNDPFLLLLLEGAAFHTGDAASRKSYDDKITKLRGKKTPWQLYYDGLAAERDLDFATAEKNYADCDADDDFTDPICIVREASVELRRGERDQAKSHITSALKLFTKSPSVLATGIFVNLVVGDIATATSLHTRLINFPGLSGYDGTHCTFYYVIGQPYNAEPFCAAAIDYRKTNSVNWSNAGYNAIDLHKYSDAVADFEKARTLYIASKDKHTVAQEMDLLWGLTISAYLSGDKTYAKTMYLEIKKEGSEFATIKGAMLLPLVWSLNTQSTMTRIIAEFK